MFKTEASKMCFKPVLDELNAVTLSRILGLQGFVNPLYP